MKPFLILASASPRRRQLLEEAGYSFEVDPSGIEEHERIWRCLHRPMRHSSPGGRPRRSHYGGDSGLILGVDTVCAVGGQILNKPVDRTDAERMIRLQEGRDTDVISGICLFRGDRQEWIGAVELSIVRFKPLSDQQRGDYLDSGRWQGKSGGYGVQDRDPFVSVVQGSFSNVVGLPMERLARLLKSYPGLVD